MDQPPDMAAILAQLQSLQNQMQTLLSLIGNQQTNGTHPPASVNASSAPAPTPRPPDAPAASMALPPPVQLMVLSQATRAILASHLATQPTAAIILGPTITYPLFSQLLTQSSFMPSPLPPPFPVFGLIPGPSTLVNQIPATNAQRVASAGSTRPLALRASETSRLAHTAAAGPMYQVQPVTVTICVRVLPPLISTHEIDEDGYWMDYHRGILYRHRRTSFDARLAEVGLIFRMTVPLHTATLISIWEEVKARMGASSFAHQPAMLPNTYADYSSQYQLLPVLLLKPSIRARANGDHHFVEEPYISANDILLSHQIAANNTPARRLLNRPEGDVYDIWYMLKWSNMESFLPWVSPGRHRCLAKRMTKGFQTDSMAEEMVDIWEIPCDCIL